MPFPRIAAIASTTNQKADGGGICQMFHAPVQSHWKSCSLAALPFIYLLDRVDAEFYGIPDEKEHKVS